jgi:hypothetical protein
MPAKYQKLHKMQNHSKNVKLSGYETDYDSNLNNQTML